MRRGDVHLDPRDRKRDVVGRPEVAASLNHALDALVQVTALEKQLPHLLDAHACRLDAVAAQHDRVAGLELHLVGVGLDRLPHADRARQPVLERVVGGLLRLDDAEAHLLCRP